MHQPDPQEGPGRCLGAVFRLLPGLFRLPFIKGAQIQEKTPFSLAKRPPPEPRLVPVLTKVWRGPSNTGPFRPFFNKHRIESAFLPPRHYICVGLYVQRSSSDLEGELKHPVCTCGRGAQMSPVPQVTSGATSSIPQNTSQNTPDGLRLAVQAGNRPVLQGPGKYPKNPQI